MDEVVADKHIPVLIAPDKGSRDTPKRWLTSGRATWMRALLGSEDGRERYGSENKRWNRSSVTPNTTSASPAFTDEAG